eukprot:gnl/MRDRNA2_/MRDRNA2_116081_c0_seq1.p1 gnl/MRDRNA2_/MRDRNA2_116081_c0~~gnl/MRDRNA2_/MRDRNA2_116081_c0_seq1.p1  ORF type:complete len:840 (-),score=163.50 gnl/MRDRNA2_/MRDRNA2_116081_c0_seq1:167-2686(-)
MSVQHNGHAIPRHRPLSHCGWQRAHALEQCRAENKALQDAKATSGKVVHFAPEHLDISCQAQKAWQQKPQATDVDEAKGVTDLFPSQQDVQNTNSKVGMDLYSQATRASAARKNRSLLRDVQTPLQRRPQSATYVRPVSAPTLRQRPRTAALSRQPGEMRTEAEMLERYTSDVVVVAASRQMRLKRSQSASAVHPRKTGSDNQSKDMKELLLFQLTTSAEVAAKTTSKTDDSNSGKPPKESRLLRAISSMPLRYQKTVPLIWVEEMHDDMRMEIKKVIASKSDIDHDIQECAAPAETLEDWLNRPGAKLPKLPSCPSLPDKLPEQENHAHNESIVYGDPEESLPSNPASPSNPISRCSPTDPSSPLISTSSKRQHDEVTDSFFAQHLLRSVTLPVGKEADNSINHRGVWKPSQSLHIAEGLAQQPSAPASEEVLRTSSKGVSEALAMQNEAPSFNVKVHVQNVSGAAEVPGNIARLGCDALDAQMDTSPKNQDEEAQPSTAGEPSPFPDEDPQSPTPGASQHHEESFSVEQFDQVMQAPHQKLEMQDGQAKNLVIPDQAMGSSNNGTESPDISPQRPEALNDPAKDQDDPEALALQDVAQRLETPMGSPEFANHPAKCQEAPEAVQMVKNAMVACPCDQHQKDCTVASTQEGSASVTHKSSSAADLGSCCRAADLPTIQMPRASSPGRNENRLGSQAPPPSRKDSSSSSSSSQFYGTSHQGDQSQEPVPEPCTGAASESQKAVLSERKLCGTLGKCPAGWKLWTAMPQPDMKLVDHRQNLSLLRPQATSSRRKRWAAPPRFAALDMAELLSAAQLVNRSQLTPRIGFESDEPGYVLACE